MLHVTQQVEGIMEHPGTRIQQGFLEPLGLNANQLATGLGVHRSTVGRLLAGEQPVTPTMAARLGAYFSVPPRWFLWMQAEYDAERVDGDLTLIEGVSPCEPNRDWLLTPTGALWIDAPWPEPEPKGVRTVQYANGALALLSSTS